MANEVNVIPAPRRCERTGGSGPFSGSVRTGVDPSLRDRRWVHYGPDNGGYEGHILRPKPAVTRVLAAYTRTRLDELSSAFLTVLVENASGLLGSREPAGQGGAPQ